MAFLITQRIVMAYIKITRKHGRASTLVSAVKCHKEIARKNKLLISQTRMALLVQLI